eukprot:6180342-Pleurochrysis_carterae.AAC.4
MCEHGCRRIHRVKREETRVVRVLGGRAWATLFHRGRRGGWGDSHREVCWLGWLGDVDDTWLRRRRLNSLTASPIEATTTGIVSWSFKRQVGLCSGGGGSGVCCAGASVGVGRGTAGATLGAGGGRTEGAGRGTFAAEVEAPAKAALRGRLAGCLRTDGKG